MEEEADELFITSLRTLHTTCGDPLQILVWREIYMYLEKCADACEHVADIVEKRRYEKFLREKGREGQRAAAQLLCEKCQLLFPTLKSSPPGG